jgi:hypothetical protein
MTISQATRLWQYTMALGYRAEIHYTEHKGAPRWANRGIILRCRRKRELWSWVWHHREWPPLMRYFKGLDRAEGTER